jgi:hypothetical protein
LLAHRLHHDRFRLLVPSRLLRRDTPPLNERNLDETAGVGPTVHPSDYIQCCCPALTVGFGLASGPLDWNNNGTATDTGVSAEINNDGNLSILKGFNDWDEVHQYLADENQHPKQTQAATR